MKNVTDGFFTFRAWKVGFSYEDAAGAGFIIEKILEMPDEDGRGIELRDAADNVQGPVSDS